MLHLGQACSKQLAGELQAHCLALRQASSRSRSTLPLSATETSGGGHEKMMESCAVQWCMCCPFWPWTLSRGRTEHILRKWIFREFPIIHGIRPQHKIFTEHPAN